MAESATRRVYRALADHGAVNHRPAELIEVSDADYDEIVAATYYYPSDADNPNEKIYLDPQTTPRKGCTFSGIPIRVDSTLHSPMIRTR